MAHLLVILNSMWSSTRLSFSPYLFLIIVEYVSRMILLAETLNALHGVKITSHVLPISHLIYANNNIIILWVNLFEATNLKQIMDAYNLWFAQLLSQASITTFIKLFLNNIPIYSMRTFCLPSCICSSSDNIVRKFWWTNNISKQNYLFLLS